MSGFHDSPYDPGMCPHWTGYGKPPDGMERADIDTICVTCANRNGLTLYRIEKMAGIFGRMLDIGVYRETGEVIVQLDNGDCSSYGASLKDRHFSLHDAVDACWGNFKESRGRYPDEPK